MPPLEIWADLSDEKFNQLLIRVIIARDDTQFPVMSGVVIYGCS